MAKLPRRPEDLPPLRRRDLHPIRAGARPWRIYFAGGPHPTTWNEFRRFGPLELARFDHHLPPPRQQDRAIVYAANKAPTCLAEVFQSTRTINRDRREPWLVCFELVRRVTLLDLSGDWPTRAGASQALNSGSREAARAWSRKIYDQYAEIEGLWYPSSMHGRNFAIALYERASSAVPSATLFHQPLNDPRLLGRLRRVAADINYQLL